MRRIILGILTAGLLLALAGCHPHGHGYYGGNNGYYNNGGSNKTVIYKPSNRPSRPHYNTNRPSRPSHPIRGGRR